MVHKVLLNFKVLSARPADPPAFAWYFIHFAPWDKLLQIAYVDSAK